MKRMIVSASSLDDRRYLVSEISKCPFPQMVAFNILNTSDKQRLAEKSDLNLEYVEPKKAILCLGEADANNIMEELEEHYRLHIHPENVVDMLRNDQCSGILAKRDGTLLMIAGSFNRYAV